MKHFSESEREFLRVNYPIYGSRQCALKLNRTSTSVNLFCSRNKIRCHIKYIQPEKRSINPNIFLNIDKEETAYFLGVLWGDGSVSKNPKLYHVAVQWKEEDAKEIYPKLLSLGKLGICSMVRKRIYKNEEKTFLHCCIYFCNKPVHNMLVKYDFLNKSTVAPKKILEKIPAKYHHDFWRGYFDADGCMYVSEKNKRYTLTFCGSYEQNWSETIKLFKKIGVKKIQLWSHRSKDGSYSKIAVQRISDIQIVGNYLYKNFKEKKLGLQRKYEKFMLFQKLIRDVDFSKSRRKT